MALFQPHDWFGAALLSLSLAVRVVCQNMDGMSSIDVLSTMSYISIEKRLFRDSYLYRFIAQPYSVHMQKPNPVYVAVCVSEATTKVHLPRMARYY